jgi:antitoxin YefM
MARIKPSRDIRPVTEFRANASQFITQIRESGAPLYLTQHGKGAAVLLDVEAYEAMVEELELLRDIRVSEAEIAAGKARPHAAVMKQLRKELKKHLGSKR